MASGWIHHKIQLTLLFYLLFPSLFNLYSKESDKPTSGICLKLFYLTEVGVCQTPSSPIVILRRKSKSAIVSVYYLLDLVQVFVQAAKVPKNIPSVLARVPRGVIISKEE